jgi:hypothetical protein
LNTAPWSNVCERKRLIVTSGNALPIIPGRYLSRCLTGHFHVPKHEIFKRQSCPCACLSITSWGITSCLIKRHSVKTYWGSGGIVLRILNLGTWWRWVVSFPLCHFTLQWYSLDRRPCGPQSRAGCCGEENWTPLVQPISP